jgi:hypothetical protein
LRPAWLTALAVLGLLALAGAAQAEREIEGNLVVTFDGGIAPRALPRAGDAPVTVTVRSDFSTVDGSDPPPQLREIAIGINKEGRIFDRGLPTCRVREIQPATIEAARKICGGAIVGSGDVEVRVHLVNQEPFTFKGPMLVFHAERTGGHRRLLAQVYGRKPPSAFVLVFKVVKTKDPTYGTLIKTTLPAPARKWAYVTHFDMRLRRVYSYRGQRHSFISASCAAPVGFTVIVYPFARATFGFAGGQQVKSSLVRECAVR